MDFDQPHGPSPSPVLTRRAVLTRTAVAGAALAALTSIDAAASGSTTGEIMNQATPAAATPASSTPTVVLVHGAFADASSWGDVTTTLLADGLAVVAFANPLRGIASDSAYLSAQVAAIPGPVLLVGHSYGGAVISGVSADATNVVGLVYIAAFAHDEGETGFDALGQFPPTPLAAALRPVTADQEHPELIIDPAQFPAIFAADVPAEITTPMAVSQRPVAGAAFAEPGLAPAWRRLPSWYAVADADLVVGTELERFFAERAGSVTVELVSSHAVMQAQPQAVVDLIRTAIETIG